MVMEILQEIMNKLVELKLEPVSATMHAGNRLFMERIQGTTKYLSNNKTMIYDVDFADTYNHSGRIPKDHFVVGDYLLKVEKWAHIDNPEEFLAILNLEIPKAPGTCFYLDGKLFLENVSFARMPLIRDQLLRDREDGDMIFHCLKIVDVGGNTTEFWASPAVKKRMGGINV
jgi:hypothetical protein